MDGASRITRGILIGGALGAFCNLFGFTESMFFSVGAGAIAGFFAGITHTVLDNRRRK